MAKPNNQPPLFAGKNRDEHTNFLREQKIFLIFVLEMCDICGSFSKWIELAEISSKLLLTIKIDSSKLVFEAQSDDPLDRDRPYLKHENPRNE